MYTKLHTTLTDHAGANEAGKLINACVHCGFCLETCPTYLDRRDERDSPRGRIYLIRQLLESGEASANSRVHLDRCLSCRSCETTCPSGMQYGRLLDIGRGLMEQKAPRPFCGRVFRQALRAVLTRPRLFALGLGLARAIRPWLPAPLRNTIPERRSPGAVPAPGHRRFMLIADGCVQRAATPLTNAAAARVLDRLGISLVSAPDAGCCGAVDYHLGAHEAGLRHMRRNIDAWWPHIEAGAEAIIFSASGCGTLLTDYGECLAHDPKYAERARRVAELARDLSQVLLAEDLALLQLQGEGRQVALHVPCTLHHGLGLSQAPRDILRRAGVELVPCRDEHLCCGSAGTHSILQASAGRRLRDRKLEALLENNPQLIATANVGCQLHLQSGTELPVHHWIELLDERMKDPGGTL